MGSGGIVLRAVALASILVIGACASASSPRTASPSTGRQTAPAATRLPAQSIAIPTDDAGAPVVMVWMSEHYYSPAKLEIPVGTTVVWRMLGTQEHDVWAYDGAFHSPTMGPGATYAHKFTVPGTYRYFCTPHYGDGMTGEILVVPR